MLPSLVLSFLLNRKTLCIATDLPKVMPLLTQCHNLNDSPQNLIPMPLEWGNRTHLEAVKSKLEQLQRKRPFDYIVCADLIYAEETFAVLIETLEYLSLLNS